MASVARKSMGRQKVKMARMEKDSNRQVTFSKRRAGLFKKASEICTLCGVEAAIIVFSPGKKAFSFGHPSVETIIDRFIVSNSPPNSRPQPVVEARRNASVCDLNMEITLMNNRVEIEKKRSDELNEIRKAKAQNYWFDVPIEELTFQHLEHLKASLENLREHVFQHGNKLMMQASSMTPFMGINPVVGYNGAFFNPNFGFGY